MTATSSMWATRSAPLRSGVHNGLVANTCIIQAAMQPPSERREHKLWHSHDTAAAYTLTIKKISRTKMARHTQSTANTSSRVLTDAGG